MKLLTKRTPWYEPHMWWPYTYQAELAMDAVYKKYGLLLSDPWMNEYNLPARAEALVDLTDPAPENWSGFLERTR